MSWRGPRRRAARRPLPFRDALHLRCRGAAGGSPPLSPKHRQCASDELGPFRSFHRPLRDLRGLRKPIGSPDRPGSSTEPAPVLRAQSRFPRPRWPFDKWSGCWLGARRPWSPPGRSCSFPSRWGAPCQGRLGGWAPLTRGVPATTRNPERPGVIMARTPSAAVRRRRRWFCSLALSSVADDCRCLLSLTTAPVPKEIRSLFGIPTRPENYLHPTEIRGGGGSGGGRRECPRPAMPASAASPAAPASRVPRALAHSSWRPSRARGGAGWRRSPGRHR